MHNPSVMRVNWKVCNVSLISGQPIFRNFWSLIPLNYKASLSDICSNLLKVWSTLFVFE